MNFERIKVESEQWVFKYKETIIPLEAIKTAGIVALLFIITALAYNTGTQATQNNHAWMVYYMPGHCDTYGRCCGPEQNGSQIVMVCKG